MVVWTTISRQMSLETEENGIWTTPDMAIFISVRWTEKYIYMELNGEHGE